jgi:NADH-quinone oxidoreductase subunit G
MTDRTICLTIDGKEVHCSEGCTIYEAATGAGIHIPTFCHHEKLEPVGACRMCLVEIEGARGLQTSCTTPTREGMVVKVHTSPAAVKARKANIEFLLTNHPLDCPVCDKGGECPLQNQAMLDGPGESRYIEDKRHKNKRYPLSELIVLDQERCVLCWRCIRFLDEWAGDHELDLFGRGADTRIDTFPGQPMTSKWQGNTIDICPVGALTSRVFRFESRVWELENTPSICPLCSVGCNIELGVKNNALRRITPRENVEVNDVWLCDKGRFAHGYVDHPDRLKTPLVRRDGELQPVAWDEALDLIAQRLAEIERTDGPKAIGGLGSTWATNEANYLLQRLMRTVLASNNIDHLGRIPDGALRLASLPSLEHKDAILLLGSDPSAEAPLVELWIKKAVLRHGARVLVANPRRIELARRGEASPETAPWLGYRPGSEALLLSGLARAIVDAGLQSQTSRVSNMDEFRAWSRDLDARHVEQGTGVPAGALRHVAEILARARRPAILFGPGFVRGRREKENLAALANLALLLSDAEVGFVPQDSNAWGALEMGVVPDRYPGQQPLGDIKVRNRLSSFWGTKLSPVEGLDFDAMMAAAREGRLKAMWIMKADPAMDCGGAGAALEALSFLVVQDLYLTATAMQADVVLPSASFAETDGSYTNLTGRLQAFHTAMRPPGEAQPDWWIIVQMARRMVSSKQKRTWELSGPAEVLNEIARLVPSYRGLSFEAMGEHGWQHQEPPPATRRTLVRVETGAAPTSSEYPLTLVTGRLLYDRGPRLRRAGRIQNLVPDGYVMLHPADARKLGLADGDDVSVISAHGQLDSRAAVSDEIVPGVAFAPCNLETAPLSTLYADRWSLPQVTVVKRGSIDGSASG